MMTTCPKGENSTGVSRTIRPVTHTADVAVKKPSTTDTEKPGAEATGSESRTPPATIRPKTLAASS